MEDSETKPIHFLVMTQRLLHPLRGTGSMSSLLPATSPCMLSCWEIRQTSEGAGGSRSEVWGACHTQRGDAVPMIPSPPWEPPFKNLEKRINAQVEAGLWALFLDWAPPTISIFPLDYPDMCHWPAMTSSSFPVKSLVKSSLIYTLQLPFLFQWLLSIAGSPSDMCT